MLFRKNETQDSLERIDKRNQELQVIEMKAQLEGLKHYISEKEGSFKGLEREISDFCRKFLDQEFAISQIGGSENNILTMDTVELINFTGRKLEELMKESDKKIKLTVNELIKKNNEVEQLQRQIFFLQGKDADKEMKERVLNGVEKETVLESVPEVVATPQKEEPKPMAGEPQINKEVRSEILNSIKNSFESIIKKPIEETPSKEELPSKIIEIKDSDIKDSVDLNITSKLQKKKVIGHLVDLSKIMESMPQIHWQILEAIGVKGLSEKSDIVDYLKEKNLSIKESSLELKVGSALGEMRVSDAVLLHKINTGVRTFYAYSLTDTGKRIFKESGKFSEEPVLSEVEILQKDHTSAYHGYGIKDSAEILKELGYKDVTISKNENKVELPNGDIYIPDIKGRSPLTGEFEYFEYELGHHKQTDFDRKCAKMRLASNVLYFIVPDVTKRSRVKNQLDDWRFSAGERAKDVEIKLTTTRNLKKNMWDTDF